MNNRLKIAGILFAVIYVITIGGIIHNELPSFKEGFTDGIQGKELNAGYWVSLVPLGENTDYVKNSVTGEQVKIQMTTIEIRENIVERSMLFIITMGLFSIILLAIIIYIPVQTYMVIASIINNNIFDKKNIKRIRHIGYAMMIFFLGMLCFDLSVAAMVSKVFAPEGYRVVNNWNTSMLLFAAVVLLFAEVLKAAVKMKEEQDLTV